MTLLNSSSIMTVVICILWLMGAFTAYPKAKRWQVENIEMIEWTNADALRCLFSVLFFWTIVWIDYLCKKWDVYEWLRAPSKF